MVFGAQADNPVPLAEDAELRAAADSDFLGDLLEIERLATQAPRTHPALRVTVLRPGVLVGAGVDTIFTRHFEAPRLLSIKGSRTSWQFCHVDDLLAAVELVVTAGGLAGEGKSDDGDGAVPQLVVAGVGSTGWLDQADVERITGKRHIELRSPLLSGCTALGSRRRARAISSSSCIRGSSKPSGSRPLGGTRATTTRQRCGLR
jgi:hypothetical protein